MRALLAVDLRRDAEAVVRLAVPWLERLQARADVVYVDTHRASLEQFTPPAFRSELDRLLLEERQRLAAVSSAIPPELLGEGFVDAGTLDEMLAARSARYDLVIVGTRGRTGLAHLWAGSVAEHVVRFSDTSVLVLREPAPASPMRLLFAVNLTEDPADISGRLAIFARRLRASVNLLNVSEPAVVAPTMEAPALYALLAEHTEEALGARARRLRELRDSAFSGIGGEAHALAGPIVPTIVERAAAADLVVVGTHGRTGLAHAVLGSVAERVVRRAAKPVLVLRGGTGGNIG